MILLKAVNLVCGTKQLHSCNIISRFKNLTIGETILSSSCHLSTNCCLHNEDVFESVELHSKKSKYGIREDKSSKAMRAYLERAKAYNEFMKQQSDEYIVGKRHLANMMGRDVETFTQKDIDEAIQYLLPSGLYDKKARPFLKPPEDVFPSTKEAEFDETGRPYHFLFYTGKPNYYSALNGIVIHLKEMNAFEDAMIRKQLSPDSKLALSVEGSSWLSKEEIEKKFVEELTVAEYTQLISSVERLIVHPYSYRIKDVIMEYRKPLMMQSTAFDAPMPEVHPDGRKFLLVKNNVRKTALADVTLWSPGTGKVTINGTDLSYFKDPQCREQLLFPLLFTGKLNSVDVEATVEGGGTSGQAGAIRWGISWALRSFVDQEMMEKMRLAGLLTRDRRRRERKKPGQAKARRKFTWKKR